jgi:uncharacterized protein Usg
MLVNNVVKALPKKRKHQMTQNLNVNTSTASTLKYQVLWYSSFIALYIWFSYWVAYDFFVWHKPIAEVNLANYVGAIVSIVFIWAGTKILKRNRIKAARPQQELLPQQPPQLTPQPTQKPIPQQPQQKAVPAAVPANSACAHYLGYLHQRQKSQEIPAECFTCEHVIKCMSSAN